MEIQNVIQKIRGLAGKTVANGCSEGEALAAANKIGQLLKTYNVSLDSVFLGEQKCVQRKVSSGQVNRHPVQQCVMSIASFCDCQCWTTGGRWAGEKFYVFFGLPTDTEMAEYLYQNIKMAMDTETENFKNSDLYAMDTGISRKTRTVSFQKGMSERIAERLREMMNERHQEETQASVTNVAIGCTDIVLLKRNKVEKELEDLGIKLRTVYTKGSRSDWSSRSAGRAAGSKVNLNRPLGNSGGPKGYLA